MRTFVLTVTALLAFSAFGANFDGVNCNSPMNASWPKLNLVADQNLPALQAQGISNLRFFVLLNYPAGGSEGFMLPIRGSNTNVVPLLGRGLDPKSPVIEYQVTRDFVFKPLGGSPIPIVSESPPAKTNTENLCLPANVKVVQLSWNVGAAVAAEMKNPILSQIDYRYKDSDLHYTFKPTLNGTTLTTTFVVPEKATSLRFTYKLLYAKKDGDSNEVGPITVDTWFPQ